MVGEWHPGSWRTRPAAQAIDYPDQALADRVSAVLARSPPLIAADCAARLRRDMQRVAAGEALLLQGGDCAERFGAPRRAEALPTLRLLGDLAARSEAALDIPVVQLARIAGQFAKPRSGLIETRVGIALPAWRGDLINSLSFTADARLPDPRRMLTAYREAASTLELVRQAAPDSFTSHEALALDYEQALTREDESGRAWCLSAHMVWIGHRTGQIDGAHVEYARGIANVVGLKCGPGLDPDTLLRLIDRVDPNNEPGRLVLIARLGADAVSMGLPRLVRAVRAEGRRVVWAVDPMHGNTTVDRGRKRRRLAAILAETRDFVAIAAAEGTRASGLHLEMTGAAVRECDADGVGASGGDPRLNAEQAAAVVAAFTDALRPNRLRAA